MFKEASVTTPLIMVKIMPIIIKYKNCSTFVGINGMISGDVFLAYTNKARIANIPKKPMT